MTVRLSTEFLERVSHLATKFDHMQCLLQQYAEGVPQSQHHTGAC